MTRIAPIDPAAATGDTATVLDTARAMFGGTPNFVTTVAHSPAAGGALLAMFTNLATGSVGPRQATLIAIAVAQANGVGYCLSGHTAIGKLHGLDDATLDAARYGNSPDRKTETLIALALAILDAHGHVADETLASARSAGLSDAEIIEVVAHVALSVFTNYMNAVAGTAIDFPEVMLAPRAE
jgi:AhpD family alkylhydroperoxidase